MELYKKYEDDYGILDILEGKVKPQIYARIYEAAFDERVSVVNLLLDGLKKKFYKEAEEKYITDQWYEFLKIYRKEIESAEDKKVLYESLWMEWQSVFENEKQGGFLTKEEEKQKERLLAQIKEVELRAKMEAKEAFSKAKEPFDQQKEKLELIEKETKKSIEFAFDFMEAAFEKGQEMVIFITELTLYDKAARFLAEHTSDRYLYYNKELLVGTKKTQLMSELKRDEM